MDSIDRQEAIDHWRLIIDATNTDDRYDMGFVDGLEFCISHLSTMPSAEPERKTGRWIDETFKPWGLVYHPYKCDQCGEHSEAYSNFCPSCGARMEEQDE